MPDFLSCESGTRMGADGMQGSGTQVVIAGAGPVGLMLACELGRAGIAPLALWHADAAAEPAADQFPEGGADTATAP
ncbi:FAD-dependent monooxygenase [Specibacter cremeus]|uniref:FAD-dependent monooxygenase n=1 Tax=Specibacter cremeus TaxID=1629051 RepID=UPI00197CAA97